MPVCRALSLFSLLISLPSILLSKSLVYKMSEKGEKSPSLFHKAQFKNACFV